MQKSKLDIPLEIRKQITEDIHKTDNLLKPVQYVSYPTNLVVSYRANWSLYVNSPSARLVSDIIFEEIFGRVREWRTTDVWGAVYNKGDYAKSHTHGENICSWVYYVDCCDKCAPLEVEDQQISPEINSFIYFDGKVNHSVLEHTCDHERVILAGNIEKDTEMMSWEQAYGV